MGFLSNYTGYDRKHMGFAEETTKQAMPDQKTGLNKTNSNMKRPARTELELMYLTDSQTFGSINKSRFLIMGARHFIAAEENVKTKYDEFFKTIGQVGLEMGYEQILSSIYSDAFIFGHSYVEIVYNTSQTQIVDLKMIDAKIIDYAKDGDKNIVIGETGKPVGYVVTVGDNPGYSSDDVPPQVDVESGQIFLEAKRVGHIKCFTFGNRLEALGMIETSLLDIKRKHKIEDSATESIYNNMHKHIIGYVGSDSRVATRKQTETTLRSLQNLSFNRYAVFQNPTKIDSIDAQLSDQTPQILRHLQNNQSGTSGVPVGVSLSTGESINRSVLNAQKQFYFLELNSLAKSISQQITVEILDKINEVNKFGEAKQVWGDIDQEDKNLKTKRLQMDILAGIISPREAREYVLSSENLVPNEDDYDKYGEQFILDKSALSSAVLSETAEEAGEE